MALFSGKGDDGTTTLFGDRTVSPASQAYANRLSSLLYALARLANHHAGIVEDSPRYRGSI